MKNSKIRIEGIDGFSFLMAGDVPHSVYPPTAGGYWKHLVSDVEPKKVLMLGIAGGTIARLILEKYPKAEITGVDYSPEILDWAKKYLKLDEIRMDIKIADAFDYVLKEEKKYDLIIVDLVDGYWYPIKVFSPSFVNELLRILNMGGQILINAPNLDWLVDQVFKPVYKKEVRENVIWGQ